MHTKGPWKIVEKNNNRVFNEYSIRPEKSPIKGAVFPIAYVVKHSLEGVGNGRSNARLIAAAPDLLDELKECRSLLLQYVDLTDNSFEIMVLERRIHAVNAVLAKAT